jgi:hypothetical protein
MRGSPVNFTGFTGGVNLADEPYNLGDGEARDLLNVIATGRGGVRKRDGASLVASTTDAGLHSLGVLELASTSYVVGAGGSSVWSVSPSGVVTSLAWPSSDTPWSFVQAAKAAGAQGPLYASNGTDVPFQWSGTGAAAAWTGTGIPRAKFMRYKSNRVWAANMPSGYAPSGGTALDDPRSAVVWSDLGNPGSFPGANVLLLSPNDGEEITGMGMLGDYLLVFKRSKTWVIYDLDTGANRVLSESTGCISPRSIAEGKEGVYFLSNAREVVVTNGSTVQTLSDRVKPLLSQMLSGARATARGAYLNGRYYLTLDTTQGPRTLDFDTHLGAWFIHDYTPMAWVEWAPAGEPALYASRPGRLEQAFTPTVKLDGADIFQAYWRGPFHTFNQSFVNKRVRRVAFDGSGLIRVALATDFRQTYIFQGRYDFQEEEGIWGQSAGVWGSGPGIWGGGLAEVSVAEILTPGVARAWSVEFGNNTEDPFIVDSYSFFINFRKDRSTA